jgi:ribonuclease D
MGPRLVTREDELRSLVTDLGTKPRVALDLESNGLFAYRACVCTVQGADEKQVVVVDALATPLDALAPLLASDRTRKVAHDVSFDARILAESGLALANVSDTSVAARMLGRAATGLASLLTSELGVNVDKKMQQHDWSSRPLDRAALAYLVSDVAHLFALADKLFAEVEERGIVDAVEEETRYRLAQSIAAAGSDDPRPPYLRLKGIERVPREELPILRGLCELREARARELDVPPYKVLTPEVLFAIAQARPRSMQDLGKIRGATQGKRARALAADVLAAVEAGLVANEIPASDTKWLERPRVPGSVAKARRAREQRLTKWRREEAKKREVDEQVVLPGHCLQDLADIDAPSMASLSAVPGIGAFRVERDGYALLAVLQEPA